MRLKRRLDRKPYKNSHVRRKLLATAERADRMLRSVDLPAGVRRDIATVERAARRAAGKL